MALRRVARTSDFTEDLRPRLVDSRDGFGIALIRGRGKYYAYSNYCPHEGGPACEGLVLGAVEGKVGERGGVKEYISSERFCITCPWHGMEFDLETGRCLADPQYRLRSYEVLVKGDEVFVSE
jgi:nitrite reductase/ring-hydroxylating ferredoxin subunit